MWSAFTKSILRKNNMGREVVRTYLGNINPQNELFPFIRERNGSIAERIARYQGSQYNPEPLMGIPIDKTFIVPGATLTRAEGAELMIQSVEDFYGGMAPTLDYVGKTILHPTNAIVRPNYYDGCVAGFANHVDRAGLTIPGQTIFSKDEALDFFDGRDGKFEKPFSLRLKTPNDSDGKGQEAIENSEHLAYLLTHYPDEIIAQNGLVLEQNLIGDKKTISAGRFMLGDDNYSFIADQQNDIHDGRDRYTGAHNVQVVRGDLDKLDVFLSHQTSPNDPRAVLVSNIHKFDREYRESFPITASRLSYDHLSGFDTNGKPVGGITDLTARMGGTCPALVLAALHLQENQNQEAVLAQVNLNYNPAVKQDYEMGEDVVFFMNQQPLRISAKIDKVY